MHSSAARSFDGAALPKLCGADIELGNFIAGDDRGTGAEASRALLARLRGFPERRSHWFTPQRPLASTPTQANTCGTRNYLAYGWNSNPQDVDRRFLAANGSSAYIDLDHVELCLPEVLSAWDHVAAWHAMLRIAQRALQEANEERDERRQIQVLANNSDGKGHSWGSHLNFLISRRTFDQIFRSKQHYLLYLASLQISSILATGQGKVGAENGRPPVRYQISQRADFFETLCGTQTTYDRPIVNARDESLCGPQGSGDPAPPARLHVIFFDAALAHGSALLRVGIMQLVLVLLELGCVNPRLILDDPLQALQDFSRDPSLRATARLIGGERVTALELQSAFLEEVKRYESRGVFDGLVPRVGEIIALWEDTLGKLDKRDWTALAPRLDWVLKRTIVERAMDEHPRLDWTSPDVKVLDHLYSSLNDDGLYRAYEAAGCVEQLVPPERIAHFIQNPPDDTRAWTRAMLLRRASANDVDVDLVDWDRVTFRLPDRRGWPRLRTVELNDPLAFTRRETEALFAATDFSALLDELHALSRGRETATPVPSAI